jgi:hypothetical protein
MLMKNSYDTIGDLNGDLPACGVLPQLTAPPRAPFVAYERYSNPITGLDRPEGSKKLRLPDFKTIGT